MPRKNAPEFSYNEKTKLYRKKIKNPNTGKWVPVYGHTKSEVRAKIIEKEQLFAAQAQAADCPTVWQYAQEWYRLNTEGLTEKTKEGLRVQINNHICPSIGNLLLCNVTTDDAKQLRTDIAQYSKETQSKILRTSRSIFSAALAAGKVQSNPFIGIKAGGRPRAEKEALTLTQQETLLDALDGTQAGTFCMIGLDSGLRREEILGLQWDCVCLDGAIPMLKVRRSLSWPKNSQPVISDQLKSVTSRRDVPIPSRLVAHLQRVKSASNSDYVIHNRAGGPMSYSSFNSLWHTVKVRTARTETITSIDPSTGREIKTEKVYKVGDQISNHRIQIKIDFSVSPHQLRHTYISTLIMRGVDLKTVQKLAGHATPDITMRVYVHLMENTPEDMYRKITSALDNTKIESNPLVEWAQAMVDLEK